MFGKPQWFKEKTVGWGLHPVTWQGWVYTLIWAGVLVIPFVALLMMRREAEAAVWLAASAGALLWDVHEIVQQVRKLPREVLYIDEHGAGRLEEPS